MNYNNRYFNTLKELIIANENHLLTKGSNFPMGEDYVVKYLNKHNLTRSQYSMSALTMEDLPAEVDFNVWYTLFTSK